MVDPKMGGSFNLSPGMKGECAAISRGADLGPRKALGSGALTKGSVAREFAPTHGIITPTSFLAGRIRADTVPENDPKRTASIPAGFMGRPDDIAAVVGFLASPDARFVTGQMIAVNGGEET